MKRKVICRTNKNFLAALSGILLSIAWIVPALAQEKPSADFAVAALSQYIWRGQELSRDSVVIQPSMTIGYDGFSANLWGNLDTDPYFETPGDDESKWNETDFTLSYGNSFGPWSIEGGYIYYGLEAIEDSQEIFLSLGYDTLLAPTLTVYRDFDSYEHWYFLFGLSHPIELSEAVSLELSGSVSYLKSEDKEAYPEINDAAPTGDRFKDFHDGIISISLPVSVSEYVTVTPSVSYTFPLSNEASDEMEWRSLGGDEDSFVYGGVTVNMAF
jgi:hypothetical protein